MGYLIVINLRENSVKLIKKDCIETCQKKATELNEWRQHNQTKYYAIETSEELGHLMRADFPCFYNSKEYEQMFEFYDNIFFE